LAPPPSIDIVLFRFFNSTVSNPVFDRIMPWLSGNALFIPAVVLGALWLCWKGGTRARLFVVVTALILLAGDNLLINVIKSAVGRPRPFLALQDVRLLVGRGNTGSFPSSHTSTWFAALVLTAAYYPRAWKWVLPVALGVSFSRIYVGVHYPSDVLAGAIIGATYAWLLLRGLQAAWRLLAHGWIPELGRRLPALVPAPSVAGAPSTEEPALAPFSEVAWFRCGVVLIVLLFVARLLYLLAGRIELSEDEAYQWLWSKHLALSYYSKPPVIAWLHALGTGIWGDTMFGVRFTSPVIAAVLSLILLRFFASAAGARPAFWLIVLMNAVPLLAVGATLITVDPPLVLGWTAAMVIGWRAIRPEGTTAQWAACGLCMGLATLSKYSGLFQLACWAFVFAAIHSARPHLRRPGPWVAAGLTLLCLTPVLVWNAQHDWITVDHVRFNATRREPWHPTARFLNDFLGGMTLLLNPVIFLATVPPMLRFRRVRMNATLAAYLFWMGGPVFLGYLGFSLYKRVFPNWIAPSVIPLLCLAVLYWYDRWKQGSPAPRRLLVAAMAVGLPIVILTHDTGLVQKLTGHPMPVEIDPTRRVQGWSELAAVVDKARRELALEGRPVFVVAAHYGLVGEITFYIPEARAAAGRDPIVFYKTSPHPDNQFYFWPGYAGHRKGQNAIFVKEVDVPEAPADGKGPPPQRPVEDPPPSDISQEFQSVTSLGVFPITPRGRTVRWMQLYACRNLL
jgi:4-amino-4-deoxy-L-arabinose transferase-like glycosyltransferase/membrane-associated phospholipid phosphatase